MKRLFRFSSGRSGATRDVDDELQFHIETRAQEFIAQGMAPDDARRAARAAFGDVDAIGDRVRADRIRYVEHTARKDWIGSLAMDITYALRALRKNPGFTAAAVTTLTLGIGATVAVFTVVNGVLLRPLPYKDPSSLSMIWLSGTEQGLGPELPLSSGLYINLRDQAPGLEKAAAFRATSYTAATEGAAEEISGARVTPQLFDVLGAHPFLGQTFTDSTDARVVVLSYGYWRRRFGEDRNVLGKRITLSGESFTIVGVMPPDFAFPRGAELPQPLGFPARTDVWTPLVFSDRDRANFGTMNLSAVGRLRPGVTHAAAQIEASGNLRRFLAQNAPRIKLDYRLVSLKEQASGHIRRSLLVLLGAVALVLLIACANVANLLIGRTSSRQREFAVRAALGAGRGRIARQLVTENIVLAGTGAVLGLLISVWFVRVMVSLMPSALPRADDVTVDWRVIALVGIVTALAGISFGLATAVHLRRINLASALQAAAGRLAGSHSHRAGRRALAIGEISLSLILVIGAAQLTASFIRLQDVDPGFSERNALVADVLIPSPDGFRPQRDGLKWRAFFAQLMDRLSAQSSVAHVGGVSGLPLTGRDEYGVATIIGRPAAPPENPNRSIYSIVSGQYFAAIGARVLSGRTFDARDVSTGLPVVVVSRAFAKKYFGTENVVGEKIGTSFEFMGAVPERTIIGVVDDVHQSLTATPTPQAYLPSDQLGYPALTIVMKPAGNDAHALAALLSREVRSLDPNAAVTRVRLLDDVVGESLTRQRFSMTIIVVFATTALLLAMVGLYGVIALSVRQRQREIGVRMALGARAGSVIRLILVEGAWVTGAGIVIGLVGALGLSRVLANMLYDARLIDPVIFAVSAAGVMAVSLAAAAIPARRATRVHPTLALRSD